MRRVGLPITNEGLRVLFLDTRDHTGGHTTVHNALIRHFDQVQTRAFAIANSGTYDSRMIEGTYRSMPGLEWTALPFGNPLTNAAGPAMKAKAIAISLSCLARAISQARRWRIDVVHTNEHQSNAVHGVVLARAIGAKYILHMHANASTNLARGTMFGLRHASAILAVSQSIRDELKGLGLSEDRIHVVHNGLDASKYDASQYAPERLAFRWRHDIADASPLIGIVARIMPWKGQLELIEAVHRLLPEFPKLRLAIIGGTRTPNDPNSFNETEHMLRKRVAALALGQVVYFAGWQADVRPWLSAMDIFALPSHGEPFGLATIEAMAMGLPAIGYHKSGAADIIVHERNGLLVAPGSVNELTSALRVLLANPDRSRRMGLDGQRHVRERFTLDPQAKMVSEIYRSVCRPT